MSFLKKSEYIIKKKKTNEEKNQKIKRTNTDWI